MLLKIVSNCMKCLTTLFLNTKKNVTNLFSTDYAQAAILQTNGFLFINCLLCEQNKL